MTKYNIHQDFKKISKFSLPLSPRLLPFLNRMIRYSTKNMELSEGCKVTDRKIEGYKGDLISITLYEPSNADTKLPCAIFLHGGAFVLEPSKHHKQLAMDFALKTPCKVIFVDYRLAPEFPFPYGLEDSYSALAWAHRHAEELQIDRDRIAVIGDSAGGCLAAGVTQLAQERDEYKICFQMLIYPVTDARQQTKSMRDFVDTPMWNAKLTEKMWVLYLHKVDPRLWKKASPNETVSLQGLPPAFIEVAEFDCLRDEGIEYAKKLEEDGVEVELKQTTGTIHGFELAYTSTYVQEIISERIKTLQKVFNS